MQLNSIDMTNWGMNKKHSTQYIFLFPEQPLDLYGGGG